MQSVIPKWKMENGELLIDNCNASLQTLGTRLKSVQLNEYSVLLDELDMLLNKFFISLDKLL